MRTLAEWLALHEAVHPRTIDMGLARVSVVARALRLDTVPFAILTVAGTNGKGSVAAHLEALLRARGASTGLFTSPHFVRYNERIRVDGMDADDAMLVAAFERIEQARGEITLTFFEYNTLAALLIFRDRGVDAAILEVGLGGRLDATNLIDADVAVLVSVGFDHRDWLGDTLEEIGREKAGVFRTGRAAVLGSPDMPASVFTAIAERGARAVVAGEDFSWRLRAGAWDYRGMRLLLASLPPSALSGTIQYGNAAAAFAALEALAQDRSPGPQAQALLARLTPFDQRAATQALREVRLAGRFQIVPGEVEWILDIAHNEPAARVLANQLRERMRSAATGRTIAVIGVLADKDARAIGAALAAVIDEWIVCALPGPRGGGAAELAQRLARPPERVRLADSVREGCQLARALARPGDRVVVCGSLHTVGPALQWLQIY